MSIFEEYGDYNFPLLKQSMSRTNFQRRKVVRAIEDQL